MLQYISLIHEGCYTDYLGKYSKTEEVYFKADGMTGHEGQQLGSCRVEATQLDHWPFFVCHCLGPLHI